MIYGELLERPRLGGTTRGRSDVPPEPLPEAAIEARWDIDVLLRRWTLLVATERDITPPDLEAAQRDLRALWSQEIIHAARARLRGRHEAAQAHLDHAHTYETDLRSGAATIGHIADWLDRHATWLLAGPHATPFARQVTKVHRDAISIAHPSRPEPRIPCACGSYVRVHPADDMQCPGCDQHGVLAWWTTHAPTPGPMRLADLHEWLLTRGLNITPRILRHWADDGLITPIDGGGQGRARRYEPTAVYLAVLETRRPA
jgi:hypothetical protein